MPQGLALGTGVLYYGGKQVSNPANVIQATTAPSSGKTTLVIGTMWINYSAGNAYQLVKKTPSSATWAILGGSTSAVATLTGGSGGAISPTAGNINLSGTANQITTAGSGSTITFALPTAASVSGATPVINNAARGQGSFTDVIANGAYGSLVVTNSVISSSSIILATASCTTVNSACHVVGITPGSGTVSFRVFNAGSASTAANININFWVLN